MPSMELQQSLRTSQIQIQKMSQQQIYSLNLLSMNSQDLRSEIYSVADKNPAIEITRDSSQTGSDVRKVAKSSLDYVHLGTVSSSGQNKADVFQEVLENQPDARETLQEHLLKQLNISKISAEKHDLIRRIIENLDSSGFHILAPISLLNSENPSENEDLLNSCLDLVHRMDPIGTGCKNFEESLFVQASLNPAASECALFLLDGHFAFLDPPRPIRILKNIKNYIEDQSKMSFKTELDDSNNYHPEDFTIEDIEDALTFIRTLDPYPAREFSAFSNVYVVPDVRVTKIPVSADLDDEKRHVIAGNGLFSFRVTLADSILPDVSISPGYVEVDSKSIQKDDKKFITNSINEAKIFIENLEFRKQTILKACCAIVHVQLAFFEKGPKYLVPLRQKDIAQLIGVHEATISRMANSKFIQCEWGLFPVKYFFSNAVSQSVSQPETHQEVFDNSIKSSSQNVVPVINISSSAISKESVKQEIAEILRLQPSGSKPLSDQKLADMLQQKGINVARRTVAKYRAQLNIDSSYNR